jgi:hypothetical protein
MFHIADPKDVKDGKITDSILPARGEGIFKKLSRRFDGNWN